MDCRLVDFAYDFAYDFKEGKVKQIQKRAFELHEVHAVALALNFLKTLLKVAVPHRSWNIVENK